MEMGNCQVNLSPDPTCDVFTVNQVINTSRATYLYASLNLSKHDMSRNPFEVAWTRVRTPVPERNSGQWADRSSQTAQDGPGVMSGYHIWNFRRKQSYHMTVDAVEICIQWKYVFPLGKIGIIPSLNGIPFIPVMPFSS